MSGSITAPADRLWWPTAFVDESMPSGLKGPDAWLHHLDNGGHQVRDEDDSEGWSFLVAEGQIVDFTFCDSFQCKPFEFGDDGAISFPEGEPTGKHFWLEDEPEACGDTLAELIEELKDFCAAEGAGNIRSCTWNNVEQPHRFTAQGGPPRFEPVEVGA